MLVPTAKPTIHLRMSATLSPSMKKDSAASVFGDLPEGCRPLDFNRVGDRGDVGSALDTEGERWSCELRLAFVERVIGAGRCLGTRELSDKESRPISTSSPPGCADIVGERLGESNWLTESSTEHTVALIRSLVHLRFASGSADPESGRSGSEVNEAEKAPVRLVTLTLTPTSSSWSRCSRALGLARPVLLLCV
jgi:hypothetical protein